MTAILGQKGEPAHVMTLPRAPRETATMVSSEIGQLRLNADWIVLSACNTAAGETSGAEALSGLAPHFLCRCPRATRFPLAGVLRRCSAANRSSFWGLEQEQAISQAEALRRSMVSLHERCAQADNAHPAVWGPFTVVGEGGRARSWPGR